MWKMKWGLNRRWMFLFLTLSLCHFETLTPSVAAEFKKTTHVYKTVGDVKIEADVHRADDEAIRPVLVWIHGGALIVGGRDSVPKNLLELCQKEGAALVSLDYRLAPEVKLPAIAEDLDDAFRWLREQGPTLLHIDLERMVVAGGSAGGYCTFLMGSRLSPPPKALVAYWGYGDFNPDWTEVHSQHHGEPVSKEEAWKGVGGPVLTGTITREQGQGRSKFYRYLRQNGLWAKTVTDLEGDRLKPYLPLHNVTKNYPPTMMVHGTVDTDVPYECSVRMAEEFKKHGVPFELVTVEGAGHGLSGGDKEKNQQAFNRGEEFIREHLK